MTENNEKEVWKPYKKTQKAIWEVSNYGRVRKNGEIYECRKSGYGYLMFSCYYVHKSVALCFIPNPDNKPQVDHINTITTDNQVENLRWATQSENNLNPITRKRSSESKKGNKNAYGKKRSLETRKKLSAALKGLFTGEQNPFYNKHHTQQSKNKNSEWHKTHKKVLCEDGKYHWIEIKDK